MRSGFRAQAEMISIIILIGITVIAGYIIYRSYSLQLSRQQSGAALAARIAQSRISEMITLASGYINASNKVAVLVFYNFGDQYTNITQIIIPGLRPGGRVVLMVFKFNIMVPAKSLRTVVLNLTSQYPDVDYPPGIIVKINVWTFTGRVYTFNIQTIG